MIYAKECKCSICGKPAVAFWPIVDPDIPANPYCRECLDKSKDNLFKRILELDASKKHPKKE